ncbi:MAG: peptidylprolyl isomerase [Phenylobacterium sp.]|jgi:peptidyl-prolyl cis-trans isomerase C|uniref:peptidylprolyl isomerase n=1 Tax=Phenylobacterium sp. TaxID=1871053 RepID=UPI001A2DEC20|nr:peptidyl-prolyl cis-trans isomerase [Phenylobacterium sp.]MBJ7408902.1 peptidylprolyl isomerase [Phenylobacterium sp.]
MASGPFRIAMIAALALGAAACDRGGDSSSPPERGDKAVARVDGKTVWASDVKREAIAQGLIGEGEPLDTSSDLFRQMMDQVIDQKLLAAEAQRRKLDKDPLAQRRLTAAQDRVMGDMLVETTVADAVTEDNIRGLYEEQQKLARRSEEIRARQIVLATATEVDQVKKLLAAGANFEALAMERSRDAATRFNGGDLGYFTTDVMPEAYEAALKGAKPGQLIGPVPTQGGFALVKVEDVRQEQPIPLDAARPQIVRFLTYDRIRDLLEKLRAKAKVETLIKPEAGAPKPVPPADAPKTVAPPAPVTPTQKGAAP